VTEQPTAEQQLDAEPTCTDACRGQHTYDTGCALDHANDRPLFDTVAAMDASPVGGNTTVPDDDLTAEEARDLADELSAELYRVGDTLDFVAECCDIADREQRPITTGQVREWLRGDRCGRQRAADSDPLYAALQWIVGKHRGGGPDSGTCETGDIRTCTLACPVHGEPPDNPADKSGPTIPNQQVNRPGAVDNPADTPPDNSRTAPDNPHAYTESGIPGICDCGRWWWKHETYREQVRAQAARLEPAIIEQERQAKRADTAEAALDRVRQLAERWRYTGDRKHGPLSELRVALDGAHAVATGPATPDTEQPTEQP
jgi:hypothetical protein